MSDRRRIYNSWGSYELPNYAADFANTFSSIEIINLETSEVNTITLDQSYFMSTTYRKIYVKNHESYVTHIPWVYVTNLPSIGDNLSEYEDMANFPNNGTHTSKTDLGLIIDADNLTAAAYNFPIIPDVIEDRYYSFLVTNSLPHGMYVCEITKTGRLVSNPLLISNSDSRFSSFTDNIFIMNGKGYVTATNESGNESIYNVDMNIGTMNEVVILNNGGEYTHYI